MVTRHVTMWIENGILYGTFAHDLHLSLDIAKSSVEARIFLSKGQSYPLVVDMRGIKSTTRDARRYMATMGTTLVKACALITGSALNRAIGNVFLSIDRPSVPSRLFTDEEKAREWLKGFV